MHYVDFCAGKRLSEIVSTIAQPRPQPIPVPSPLPALAANNLAGNYQGEVKYGSGYSGKMGNACVVKISKIDQFGSQALKFSMNNAETLEFDQKKVREALQSGNKKIKLVNRIGTKDSNSTELMNMTLGANGSLRFLKMIRRYGVASQLGNSAIACYKLQKR